MYVIKRAGRKESVKFDKTEKCFTSCKGVYKLGALQPAYNVNTITIKIK